ncbi:MAG: permease-like cell division protein FtsX [Duncaniella sp.]|uniref:cell division protein FtsX n=1 Tax=Duncaniella sp. TaxID=2518496 RepID=UPI0023CB4BFD|nr:permease-like cell division protein FtsX [Duncaniella sp.]MDE5989012.1 permease-like cell division protein FtsX [Duncaniella sp.]
MARRRPHIIPLFTTRATATVSVALVLFILGMASLIGIATRVVTDNIRENMGFVVMFNEDVTASDIASVKSMFEKDPGVSSTVFSSPDAVLERWQAMVGEEEDIIRLSGINPFVAELEVHVNPEYASSDSLDRMIAPLMLLPQVGEVKVHTELVDRVNATLRSVGLGLLVVAVALLIVSFVLIFNTVRLSVYARRFTIYTMKLVGATGGFIRRPFLFDNIVNGLVAGLLASGALILVVLYCSSLDLSVAEILTWQAVLPVIGGLLVTGVFICLVAALFATNRYLRLSYDEMFK